jgi:type I restriction enzyme R subunit
MDENAFSILRIMEAIAPETAHDALQTAAIAIGAVYADAAATQPAFAHMEAYLRTLRQQVRRILTDHGIGETKAIREKVEDFAVNAYGAGADAHDPLAGPRSPTSFAAAPAPPSGASR